MSLVQVGKLLTSYGVKGQAKVSVLTDFVDQRFQKGNVLVIKSLDVELTIDLVNKYQDFLLIKFKELQTPEEVKKYSNSFLYIEEKERQQLKDEYYFQDLVGCLVFNQKEIGIVSEVMRYPKQDILRIKTLNKDVLIPFVEAWIIKVDLKEKRIQIIDYDN
ncbi:MAG: ribosome maturation factor RimM [Bacillales bacterium]|jgi:16S rRNA processing protein RimM|nr:ribosome maturation factor RimM [Bacillales bacterium]